MTADEMRDLRPGDIIGPKLSGQSLVVTANCLSRVTAVRAADVRTANVTNPSEWDLILKASHPAGIQAPTDHEKSADPRREAFDDLSRLAASWQSLIDLLRGGPSGRSAPPAAGLMTGPESNRHLDEEIAGGAFEADGDVGEETR